MYDQLKSLWDQVLQYLSSEKNISNLSFKEWIKNSNVTEESTEDNLIIELPNDFARDWVEKKYSGVLSEALMSIAKRPIRLNFVTKNPLKNEQQSERISDTEQVNTRYSNDEMAIIKATSKSTNTYDHEINKPNYGDYKDSFEEFEDAGTLLLNPKYTFDSFVVGNNNRFAHAAAMAVSEAPGKAYNPLFLYGGVGLGKTHLMQAIGHQVLQINSNSKVVYVSCEQFTNELINAIRFGKTSEFRGKYRNVDVLLIDDIQFLSGKERIQEEFFHTFNTLYEVGKQIVVSSDRPPKEIATLESRLRSRFEWGLTTDIQAPDLETRVAILKKKAAFDEIQISNEVLIYIAGQIHSNIRELEGALVRVTAYSKITGIELSVELATSVLKDMLPANKPRPINVELIQKTVADYFKIDASDLSSKTRVRSIAMPRQIAMYLTRELTDLSLPKIGEEFGGRDHSTVIHACDKILQDINQDSELSETVKNIIAQLKNNS